MKVDWREHAPVVGHAVGGDDGNVDTKKVVAP